MAECTLCYNVITILTLLCSGGGTNLEQKRILMTDQSYVQTQLDHLQAEIQELRVKADSQQTTIKTHEITIKTLQSTVNYQQEVISQLLSNITTQRAEITSQTTNQTSLMHSLQYTVSSQQDIITELKRNITSSQATYLDRITKMQSQLQFSIDNGKGITFVRWGRTDCPLNYSLLYSGYAGGSWYQHKGAAADYQCLPRDPIGGPDKNCAPGDGYVAYMFGAEYQNSHVFGSFENKDVPCAVCYATVFSTSIMIPARTECYSGWTEAYHGDLSAGQPGDNASSVYVCLDQHLQALDGGGNQNDDGKLFFPVKAKCGSLRCPPYENDKILSCVVCVK